MSESNAGVEEMMLAEARTEVSSADQKASIILAALGIGFGVVLGGLLAGDWTPSDQGAGEWAWWVSAALALLSVVVAAAAVWPRYSKRASGVIHYWGDVARLSSAEDLSKELNTTPPIQRQRTLDQLWHLSRIVVAKYTFIRVALIAAGLAVVACLISASLAP